MAQQTVYGSQYPKVGGVHVVPIDDRRCIGTTAGKKQSVRKKLDGNEDAAAYRQLENGAELFLVADSHYGALAANLAVDLFYECFSPTQGSMQQRLLQAHFQLDRRVRAEMAGASGIQPGCSTTFISAVLADGRLSLVSTGDSRAMLIAEGECEDLLEGDEGETMFLGNEQRNIMMLVTALEKWGITDVSTERADAIRVLSLLDGIFRSVKRNRAFKEEMQKAIDEVVAITRIPFPFTVESLMESWHEMHLMFSRAMPQSVETRLREDDILLLASDGIDEHESGLDGARIAKLLTERRPLKKRTERLLDACNSRRGGNDNVTVVVAHI